MSPAMVYGLRTCLRCSQIAKRCFSSQSRRLEEQGTEKDFRPKKALLVRKVTRYEYEKFYLKPELSEAQLQEYVRIRGIRCHFAVLLLSWLMSGPVYRHFGANLPNWYCALC